MNKLRGYLSVYFTPDIVVKLYSLLSIWGFLRLIYEVVYFVNLSSVKIKPVQNKMIN